MKNTLNTGFGRVQVSDEAIGEIAALAAQKVPGVAGMGSGSGVESLAGLLGIRPQGKGVAVEMGVSQLNLRLFLIVEFGAEIAEVCLQVQDAVAQAVEKMSGLEVKAVDVTVQGVRFGGAERRSK